jgi:hypothetical protein
MDLVDMHTPRFARPDCPENSSIELVASVQLVSGNLVFSTSSVVATVAVAMAAIDMWLHAEINFHTPNLKMINEIKVVIILLLLNLIILECMPKYYINELLLTVRIHYQLN